MSTITTDSQRIREIEKLIGLSTNKLAYEIGLKAPQTLYDILNNKHGISKDLAEKFYAKYSINKLWLLTGEGEMLNNIAQHNISGDNIAGNGITVNKAEVDKFLEVLANAQKQIDTSQGQISKSQEQIDRLIGLLEKK